MEGRQFDGARLRYLRQAAGVTMQDLANGIGCSKGHLRQAETLDRRLSPELAGAAAKFLSAQGQPVTIDDIYVPIAAKPAA